MAETEPVADRPSGGTWGFGAEASSGAAARAARRGIVVLTLINLVNYLDRYVVAALGESLRTSSLGVRDAAFGLLTSVFIVTYTLAAPLFGRWGDRGSRTRLIALGIAIWSLASALGGLAGSLATLFLARALVGVGEAAYGTIAPSLLADYYPRRFRGRVFAIFFAAIPIGSALGYVVGGLMDVHFGWRSAFYAAGAPGLLLAALALGLPNPPRGAYDPPEAGAARSGPGGTRSARAAYAQLVANRPYVRTVLGYAAYTFALGGMAVFMPKFLMRVRGLPEAAATSWFGVIIVATGLLGSTAGGWVGDALLPRTRQAYLWLSGLTTLAAVPAALAALTSPQPVVYWTGIILAEVLLFASTGPVNSAIVNVVAPTIRATAVAVSIFAIHVLGDVPSPAILGALSDATSLAAAVLIIPVALLAAAVIWTYAAWRGEHARAGEPTP